MSGWSIQYIIYFGTIGFSLGLLGLLSSERFRSWFLSIYKLPEPNNQRVIPVFDSIRGICALWVALFHAWAWLSPINNIGHFKIIKVGQLAVPAFIILSGFFIFRSLYYSSNLELGSYLKRRLLRIYPLYFCVVSFMLITGLVIWNNLEIKDIVGQYLMFGIIGWQDYVHPAIWSVYIEELFYLTLPIWMLVFRKKALIGSILTYGILLTISLKVFGGRTWTLLPFFALGMILSFMLESKFLAKYKNLHRIGLVLGLYFFWVVIYNPMVQDLPPDHYWHYQYWLFGLAIVAIYNGIYRLDLINRILSVYPLRVLGVISFSIYLIHPIIIILGTGKRFLPNGEVVGTLSLSIRHDPLVFLATYTTAIIFYSCVTYFFIEYQFLKLRKANITSDLKNHINNLRSYWKNEDGNINKIGGS